MSQKKTFSCRTKRVLFSIPINTSCFWTYKAERKILYNDFTISLWWLWWWWWWWNITKWCSKYIEIFKWDCRVLNIIRLQEWIALLAYWTLLINQRYAHKFNFILENKSNKHEGEKWIVMAKIRSPSLNIIKCRK